MASITIGSLTCCSSTPAPEQLSTKVVPSALLTMTPRAEEGGELEGGVGVRPIQGSPGSSVSTLTSSRAGVARGLHSHQDRSAALDGVPSATAHFSPGFTFQGSVVSSAQLVQTGDSSLQQPELHCGIVTFRSISPVHLPPPAADPASLSGSGSTVVQPWVHSPCRVQRLQEVVWSVEWDKTCCGLSPALRLREAGRCRGE